MLNKHFLRGSRWESPARCLSTTREPSIFLPVFSSTSCWIPTPSSLDIILYTRPRAMINWWQLLACLPLWDGRIRLAVLMHPRSVRAIRELPLFIWCPLRSFRLPTTQRLAICHRVGPVPVPVCTIHTKAPKIQLIDLKIPADRQDVACYDS